MRIPIFERKRRRDEEKARAKAESFTEAVELIASGKDLDDATVDDLVERFGEAALREAVEQRQQVTALRERVAQRPDLVARRRKLEADVEKADHARDAWLEKHATAQRKRKDEIAAVLDELREIGQAAVQLEELLGPTAEEDELRAELAKLTPRPNQTTGPEQREKLERQLARQQGTLDERREKHAALVKQIEISGNATTGRVLQEEKRLAQAIEHLERQMARTRAHLEDHGRREQIRKRLAELQEQKLGVAI